MGLTKTDLFTEEQNEMASFARVLAHPARLAILQYLIRSNSCINTELVSELGLAQATVSQHLRELKDSGLIQGEIEGVKMNYCINLEQWELLHARFNDFFDRGHACHNFKCC